jgi:XRE family transcriptional regulator, fatty acid utilization regulator
MSGPTLTGSRIRARRVLLGQKQADLARRVGISPAYLNLIEHNRRRIGGKLLIDLAREMGVEVSLLSEGAEVALLEGLRDAASGALSGPLAAAATAATGPHAGSHTGRASPGSSSGAIPDLNTGLNTGPATGSAAGATAGAISGRPARRPAAPTAASGQPAGVSGGGVPGAQLMGSEGAAAASAGAATLAGAVAPEMDKVEDLAGRYPGWAGLIRAQHGRIAALERTVETLTDRLTHDPFLSASLHEMLSNVTAIRASAGILVNGGDIDPEWQARFHRNIYEDSQRLADSSRALVSYLDAGADEDQGTTAPQDEVDQWLQARGWHVAELEGPGPASVDAVLAEAPPLDSRPARSLASAWLGRYREDALRLPLRSFRAQAEAAVGDPAVLAERFGTDLARILRRLGSLPGAVDDKGGTGGTGPYGLVICDGSGTLTLRKPAAGFSLPRFGAACPLWPLYQALARPMVPIRARLELAGREPRRFMAWAVAQPVGAPRFDAPQVLEATMLILPEDASQPGSTSAAVAEMAAGLPVQPVGTSCRICPQDNCAARREPSILAEGF